MENHQVFNFGICLVLTGSLVLIKYRIPLRTICKYPMPEPKKSFLVTGTIFARQFEEVSFDELYYRLLQFGFEEKTYDDLYKGLCISLQNHPELYDNQHFLTNLSFTLLFMSDKRFSDEMYENYLSLFSECFTHALKNKKLVLCTVDKEIVGYKTNKQLTGALPLPFEFVGSYERILKHSEVVSPRYPAGDVEVSSEFLLQN